MLSHCLTSSIFCIKMQVVFFNQIWSYLLCNLIFNSHLHPVHLLTPTLCFLFKIICRLFLIFMYLFLSSLVYMSQYPYFIIALCITDSIRHDYCPSFKHLLSVFILWRFDPSICSVVQKSPVGRLPSRWRKRSFVHSN